MIDPTWIKQRHEYWWHALLNKVYVPSNFDQSIPAVRYAARSSRCAAWANAHWCKYNVAYWLQEGPAYDHTVAHEVCHTFADRLVAYRTDHGALWDYLYRVVLGFDHGRYHSYRRVTKLSIDPRAVPLAKLLASVGDRT